MQVPTNIPNHVAVILDGNRRWAVDNGLERIEGYRKGGEKFEEFLNWSLETGVKRISAYVMSIENYLQRSKKEVGNVINVLCDFIDKWLQPGGLIDKHHVKVDFVGNLSLLPAKLLNLIKKMREKTKSYKSKFVDILIAYSGKEEIAKAMQNIFKNIMGTNGVKITPKTIEKNLSVKSDVDLVIRTGGGNRLSNFLLWQTAYAEIYTTKTLWPDFSKREFLKALNWFSGTQRNFGK